MKTISVTDKLEQEIFSKLKERVKETASDISNMFSNKSKIELVENEEEWLFNNLSQTIKVRGGKVSYKDLERALKNMLVLKIKKEFVEKFLREELEIPIVEKEIVNIFLDVTKLGFHTKNELQIKSENCYSYPRFSFFVSWQSPIIPFIVEESLSSEFREMQMKQIFGGVKTIHTQFKKYIQNKLDCALIDELTIIQSELNNYYKSKMDWFFELNENYHYISKAAE